MDLLNRCILILGFGLISSCVNVSLPSGSGKKAERVRFEPPSAPFRVLNTPEADRAWVSDKTGNTISFLSDCEGRLDPSLKQLQSESLNVLTKLKIDDEKTFLYNGREALQATATGEVDGVAIRMKLLVLKKNDCNYTLTYTAVPKTFAEEIRAFDGFTKEFRAP